VPSLPVSNVDLECINTTHTSFDIIERE
jgi:hypothetical protein